MRRGDVLEAPFGKSTMKNAMNALACSGFVLAALVVGGCKKSPEPESVAVPLPALPPASESSANPAPAAVAWEDPPEWRRLPAGNPMRKATYRVPKAGAESEDGELAVFYFGPNQGGSLEANVERWVKQFSDASDVKRSERTAHGLRQHIVEIETGTFSSGMPGGPTTPKKGYGLLGAIVLTPSGPYFFKLTGPTETLNRSRETFFVLLDSVKAS